MRTHEIRYALGNLYRYVREALSWIMLIEDWHVEDKR